LGTTTTTAQRLKIIRGDLSQAEFAKRLGVHQNTLGRYERGVTEPDTSIARALCTIFGVEPRWLLLGEGVMRSPGCASDELAADIRTALSETALEQELAALRRETAELRKEGKELRQENKELHQENRELNLTVRRLLEENGDLRVAMVENKAAPPASTGQTRDA
jgi:transcriptional regulator with XRE-family HTH domain